MVIGVVNGIALLKNLIDLDLISATFLGFINSQIRPFENLLVIDADRFKRINDNYGHAIGDRCLQEIIKRTIPLLRKNDMLARYGGEEFVVIMPHTNADGAREAGEKIRQTIEKIEFLYKNKVVRVTVSIGISQTREGDTDHQQVFERADLAVYKAKESGRNQVMVN